MTDINANERELNSIETVYQNLAQRHDFQLMVPKEEPQEHFGNKYQLIKEGLPFELTMEYVEQGDRSCFDVVLNWHLAMDTIQKPKIDPEFKSERKFTREINKLNQSLVSYHILCRKLSCEGPQRQYKAIHHGEERGLVLHLKSSTDSFDTNGPSDVLKLGKILDIINYTFPEDKSWIETARDSYFVIKAYNDGTKADLEFNYKEGLPKRCYINLASNDITLEEYMRNAENDIGNVEEPMDKLTLSLIGLKERFSSLRDKNIKYDIFFKGVSDSEEGFAFIYDIPLESSQDIQDILKDFEIDCLKIMRGERWI